MALPSWSAIKYTVIDNKTANINEKKLQFIYCVNSHASKTAKIIKRWYNSASHWHLDDVMVGNMTFLSYLQFLMRGC